MPTVSLRCLKPVLTLLLGSLLGCCAPLALAAPHIVVSIKPLQHLVAGLLGENADVRVLMPSGADPHHFSLRPSQRRLLEAADIVLWVGPALEQPLADLVTQLDADILTLADLPGMQLLHAGNSIDPHLWLDPDNALVVAGALTALLQKHDPQLHVSIEAFQKQLDQTGAIIRTELLPHLGIAHWAVEHDAYRYFSARFQLPAPLVLRDNNNAEPGLRTATAFRDTFRQQQLACIVAEPEANPAQLRSFLDLPDLQVATADILGNNIKVSDTSFSELLISVAETITACAGTTP